MLLILNTVLYTILHISHPIIIIGLYKYYDVVSNILEPEPTAYCWSCDQHCCVGEPQSVVIRRWLADGTSLELRTERRSMAFYRSHGQWCFIDAMVDGISWSVRVTAIFVAWVLQQAMERRSHGCFCFVGRWSKFCVGAVDDGDMKLPWSMAFHCSCSRHFV